jgi:hypothetical protein
MLDDGVQGTGADMRVADVATLLAEAVDAGARPSSDASSNGRAAG